ncbi:glycosyltransferase EpsF [Halobacillus karajensis]|uniref:glycosyltransferase family 1 protein n=1 Tax=Halobacillus karajensis TaxID=195088 RepID=UPI0008A72361|nr:glycosyltransferase family 1 protein [Halobacillus karajensis]SEH43999.1 glycosyltransferase EpsF [Halobacillus karajensis]
MKQTPIKIVHVFATMNTGGAESRIMDVYRKINRNDVQFDFIVLDNNRHYYDSEIRGMGGKKIVVTSPRKNIFKHVYDLYRVFRKNDDYQAVHTHTSYHSGIVCLIARIAGIKYRVSHARTTSTKSHKKILKKIFISLGRNLIVRNSTSLLAISKKAGEYVFGKRVVEFGRVRVVPNAIDIEKYMSASKDENLKEELGITEGQLIIGQVGRFSFMKNHKFTIKVFKSIIAEGIDAKLILAGDGELRRSIETLVEKEGLKEQIVFLGVRNDIPQIMKLLDVLIMPSIYEGLGGVVIEAQAAGTPCVVSKSLPVEVDMGLNLVKFVSLDQSVEDWKEEIKAQSLLTPTDKYYIKEKFIKKGMLLESEIKDLYQSYGLHERSVIK